MIGKSENSFYHPADSLDIIGVQVSIIYPKDVIHVKKNACRFRIDGLTYDLRISYALGDDQSVVFLLSNNDLAKEFRSDKFRVEELCLYCDINEKKQLMPWLDYLMMNQVYICEPSISSFQISFVFVSIKDFNVVKTIMLRLILYQTFFSNAFTQRQKDCDTLNRIFWYNETIEVYKPVLDNDFLIEDEISSQMFLSEMKDKLENTPTYPVKLGNVTFKITGVELLKHQNLKTFENSGDREQQMVLNTLYLNGKINKKVYAPRLFLSSISKHDSETEKEKIMNSFPGFIKNYRELNLGKGIFGLSKDFRKPNPFRVFDLSANILSDISLNCILDSIKFSSTSLVELQLNSIGFSNKLLRFLTPLVKNLSQLIEIGLECNSIFGQEELQDFGQAFSAPHCIRFIYLGNNRISFAGAKILCEVLKVLPSLKQLNLAKNELGNKSIKKLSVYCFVSFIENPNTD